jgi:hypothetical protein
MRTHELDGRAPHHGRAGLYDCADPGHRNGCGAAALHPARANRRHGRLDCGRALGSGDEPTDAARTHCRARNNYTTRNAACRNAQRRLVRSGGKRCVSGLFALTPCVPLSRRAGEGERAAPLAHAVGEGLGVRAKQRALPANSEPKRCALTPCVPLSRRAGEGERAAPLAHAVGEGLGVRAKQRALPANSEPKRCTLTPCVPLSRRAGEGERAAPLAHAVGKGLGVRAIRRGILSNIYRAFSVRELPPSLRFPPLREGNRRGAVWLPLLREGNRRGAVWLPLLREGNRRGAVPPARRGNLKEGVLAYPCLHKLWLSDWYHTSGGRYLLS